MANRQRAEARRKAAAKAAKSEGGGSKLWIWVTVGVVAVIAVVGAVVVLGGGDEDGAADGGSDTTAEQTTSSFPDSQPVTITGEPLPSYEGGAADSAVGLTAPRLEGSDFQGDPVVVDGAENGPTMLVFLAHWCPHCNAEVPVLLDWKNSGAVPADLNVVGIATAAAESAVNYPPADWFSSKGWSWPVLVDEKLGEGEAGMAAVAYGATGWPYIVVIDGEGNVTARASGEKTVAEIEALVATAL